MLLGAGPLPEEASEPAKADVAIGCDGRPESHYLTDGDSGWCLLPPHCAGSVRLELLGEPGLLPVQIGWGELAKPDPSLPPTWFQAPLRPNPNMLRVLRSAGDARVLRLCLGGSASLPEGWVPAQVLVQHLDEAPSGVVECPDKALGCEWRGQRRDLADHRRHCEQIRRIAALVKNAKGQQGTLSVSLSWFNHHKKTDLDMHITHPCGCEPVSFHQKRCCHCTAHLDVDDQGKANDMSCENVFWSEDAPHGTYTIDVRKHNGPKLPFQLLVKVGSQPFLIEHTPEASGKGSDEAAASFELGPEGVSFNCFASDRTGLRQFKRAAWSVYAAQKLAASGTPDQAADPSWGDATDSGGWCQLLEGAKALRVAPLAFKDHKDLEATAKDVVLECCCSDLPMEVVAPWEPT